MVAVGGSIQETSIAGRTFTVAFDTDSNRDLGGFTNEVEPNGNGTGRLIKNRKKWMVDGLNVEIDDDRGDQEFLQNVSDGNGFVVISVTYVSGAVYEGSGILTGDFAAGSQAATAPVILGGPGRLTKQT